MKTLCLGLVALLTVACGSDTDRTKTQPQKPDPGSLVDKTKDDAPEITGEGPRSSRVRKLTVDELQQSIPVVAGNDAQGQPIRWRYNGEDALDDAAFGRVLGRPDYVAVTAESELPSTLYVKFIRDMARDVCNQIVQADAVRTPSEATLWPHAPSTSAPNDAQLTANLQYLTLRLLGIKQ